ncbi:MAG: hypothetical protein HZB83_06470 [Deltaproteobacteria bacterium]|nr:hypothetical protein [Deltaproteobacteria bacterium]
MKMKKKIVAAFAAAAAAILISGWHDAANATPSTHIWSPSTDVQAYGVFHLTSDMYLPVKKDAYGTRLNTVTNVGLTTGVLPYEKLNLEVGFDHIAGFGSLDAYPLYLNAKVGVPENAYGEMFPALAAGVYSYGTKTGGEARTGMTPKIGTDYNIYYAKAAKTIGQAGRFSLGYYSGNKKLLVDENGESAENGVLLCWERTISEISENLWASVDYMGGKSGFGALSYGFSWKFAPNTSVIFGYVAPNNDKLAAVADTFTVQVDIDFDVFNKKK